MIQYWILAGSVLLAGLFFQAWRGTQAQKQKSLHQLAETPFDSGINQAETLAELENVYHSKKSLNNINKMDVP